MEGLLAMGSGCGCSCEHCRFHQGSCSSCKPHGNEQPSVAAATSAKRAPADLAKAMEILCSTLKTIRPKAGLATSDPYFIPGEVLWGAGIGAGGENAAPFI